MNRPTPSSIHNYLNSIRSIGPSVDIDLTRSGITNPVNDSEQSIETPGLSWQDWVPEAMGEIGSAYLTPGSSGAVSAAILQAKLSYANCVVAIESPGYPMYESIADAYGLQAVKFTRYPEEFDLGGLMTLAQIVSTQNVSLICLTEPNNPTGYELSGTEFLEISSMASSAGALLLIDRVFADFAKAPTLYEHLKFDGYIARSFSKSLAVGGMRCGWLSSFGSAPNPAEAIDILLGQPVSPSEVSVQFDRLSGLWSRGIAKARDVVATNTRVLNSWADPMTEVEVFAPQARVPYRILRTSDESGKDIASQLRLQASVGVVPGYAFGMSPSYFRVGLGGETSALEAGLERVTKYL